MLRTIFRSKEFSLPLEVIAAKLIIATLLFMLGLCTTLLTRWFRERVPPVMMSRLLRPNLSFLTSRTLRPSLTFLIGSRLAMNICLMDRLRDQYRSRRCLSISLSTGGELRRFPAVTRISPRQISLRGTRSRLLLFQRRSMVVRRIRLLERTRESLLRRRREHVGKDCFVVWLRRRVQSIVK